MTRMTYEETMAYGTNQYADVLAMLGQAGLPAEFIQTGGMNAAISVTLEAGYYLLIADQKDSLAWDRSAHSGWYVGLYPPEDSSVEGPIRWLESDRSDPHSMMSLVEDVMTKRRGEDAR